MPTPEKWLWYGIALLGSLAKGCQGETIMEFIQQKNKTRIRLEFKAKGIAYDLQDETIRKSEFIPYEHINNQTHEVFDSNKSYRNNAVYSAVVGALFLLINVFYGAKLWVWIFLAAGPIFYLLYRRSKVAMKVYGTDGRNDIFLLQDQQLPTIEETLYSRRNTYLKRQYGRIDYQAEPSAELDKFRWLLELGVISEREFEVIEDEIENGY